MTDRGGVDAIYDGLSALFRTTRRARQRWSEEHPGLPTRARRHRRLTLRPPVGADHVRAASVGVTRARGV
ncbi:MAG TPA: hypothetical protein VEV65_05175 [Kineosporiaceae bacterium]|nr:hypothetical protein [Kineosporiaceae bacterium]